MSYPYVLKIIGKTSNGIGGYESNGGSGAQVTMQWRARFYGDQGQIYVRTFDMERMVVTIRCKHIETVDLVVEEYSLTLLVKDRFVQ